MTPITRFCYLFWPDIKKLNYNQKLDLKFEFLQALRKIVNNTDSLNSKSTHSNNNSYFNPLILPPFQQLQQPQMYAHSPMLQNLSNTNAYYSLPLITYPLQVNQTKINLLNLLILSSYNLYYLKNCFKFNC